MVFQNGRKTLKDYYEAAAENYKDKMSCGFCGWLRNRELAVTFDMIPKDGHGKNALDAGCGPALYSQMLRERGYDITAIDISPKMVAIARSLGFDAYEMDIEHSEPIPELQSSFDFVLCAGVLEFAEDVTKFLRALRALMKDNAEMVLVAPLAGTFGGFYRCHLAKLGIPARVYTRM